MSTKPRIHPRSLPKPGQSLADLHPEVAAQWVQPFGDKDVAAGRTPENTKPGANFKVWWSCPKCHPDYAAAVGERARGSGCPACAGRGAPQPGESLADLNPEVAAQWVRPVEDRHMADGRTPENTRPGSGMKALWSCPKGHPDYAAAVGERARGSGCPACGREAIGTSQSMPKPGQSLADLHPEVAAQWVRPVDEKDVAAGRTPENTKPGANFKVWWSCPKCHPDYAAAVGQRIRGRGCPACGREAIGTSQSMPKPGQSLADLHPEVAAQWVQPFGDRDVAAGRAPENIRARSNMKAWWSCPKGHPDYAAVVNNRTSQGNGCPGCGSLADLHPEIAGQWVQPFEGKDIAAGRTPENTRPGSDMKVWWFCPKGHPDYAAAVYSRTSGAGCPCQHRKLSLARARLLVEDLRGRYRQLPWTEKLLIAENDPELTKDQALTLVSLAAGETGLPREQGDDDDDIEIQEPKDPDAELPPESDFEDFGGDNTDSGGGWCGGPREWEPESGPEDDLDGPESEDREPGLPGVDPKETALQVARAAAAIRDTPELLEHILDQGADRLWVAADRADNPLDTLAQVDAAVAQEPGEYTKMVRERFAGELHAALNVTPPPGWKFAPNGVLAEPTLMQKRVVARLAAGRHLVNLSGTGAGKTVSAILAARTMGAGQDGVVLVVAPNNVLGTWKQALAATYPDHRVQERTWEPSWSPGGGPKWLLLNYEMFQSAKAKPGINNLVNKVGIDMLVFDEVHMGKVREKVSDKKASIRRQWLLYLRQRVHTKGKRTPVLGMTATPVINDLREPLSLLSLVTNEDYSHMETKKTLSNATRVRGVLMNRAVRQMPNYDVAAPVTEVQVDAQHLYDAVYRLGRTPNMSAVDQTLLPAKLPTIVQACTDAVARGSKAVVYTDMVDGMAAPIIAALRDAGLRPIEYTGMEKTDLTRFTGMDASGQQVQVTDEANVLVGSRVVGTGLDGLQRVANTLVFACLPWTEAEYQQITGRLVRTGQKRDVDVIIPSTFITTPLADKSGSHRWAWDERRLQRIKHKRTIAAVVLEGQYVEAKDLVSKQEFSRGLTGLLQRMTGDQLPAGIPELEPVDVGELPQDGDMERKRVARAASDLTKMNSRWCRSSSTTTHKRLAGDPGEWREYHRHYAAARRGWSLVPAERFAAMLDARPDARKVADLGCGTMLLADSVKSAHHEIVGFDHVAADSRVVVADIADLPDVPDASFDVAVLSLALMGSNYDDYLSTALRILRPDGLLWLSEPRHKIGDEYERVRLALLDRGFALNELDGDDRFAIITATKSSRLPHTRPRPLLLSAGADEAAA